VSRLSRIAVAGLSLGLATLCVAQPPLARVYVKDGQVVSEGLKPIDTTSWDDTPQVGEVEGVECFVNEGGNEWLRLVLDPAWPQDYTGPATIGIRFFDGRPGERSGPLMMQFDSADPARLVNGAWAWTPPVWRAGSGRWLTAYWTIEKPAFRHRQLGADFGISGKTNRGLPTLNTAEVTVTRAGILLTADVEGLALGDRGVAHVTAKVFGPDGAPAPDGTLVTFAAALGMCDPTQVAVAGGTATTTFTPAGEMGEAVIQASCDFTAHEMRLPLVSGSGGVTEVDWVVSDFEHEGELPVAGPHFTRDVKGTLAVLPEAAHSGENGAACEYEGVPGARWFSAGVEFPVQIPGVLRGVSFWAKCTEPNTELRWTMLDQEEEEWTFSAPVLETGQNGWRRHGSSTVDPYFPTDNALLDYPLTFGWASVIREPWSNAQQGTLYIDDIVARVMVAKSEVEELHLVAP